MNLKRTPYLLVDADANEVRLLTLRQAMQRLTDDDGDSMAAIIDLSRCQSVFDRRAKGKQEWSTHDIEAVTGLHLRVVDAWTRAGIIPVSHRDGRGGKRIYSRQAAFIAAVAASIRRQCMLPLPMLAKVSELLAEADETVVDVVDIERN